MQLKDLIIQALNEDIGNGDVTVKALIDFNFNGEARLISKDSGVLCGSEVFVGTFKTVDKGLDIKFMKADGARFTENEELAVIKGRAASILKAERTALNFLQTLSAVATKTRKVVDFLQNKGSTIKILDTRKTIPLFRQLQKYGVRIGGGFNHRMGLYDMILIKENHLAFYQSIYDAIRRAKDFSPFYKVEVEVQTIAELNSVIQAEPEIIMLDNFKIPQLKEAVKMIRQQSSRIKIEYSGNASIDFLDKIFDLDIDYVSMGMLTKNIESIDFSLLFVK